MAWLGDELKTFLKTQAAITAIVGSGNAAKIFEISKTQGIPQRASRRGSFLTYQVLGGPVFSSLAGEIGLGATRVEMRAYGDSPTAGEALLEKVRHACATTGSAATWGATAIARAVVDTTPETGVIKSKSGGDWMRFFLAQDLSITFETSLPS